MCRSVPILVIAVAFLSPAQASNPGEPLDCSDWVFLQPGYSCELFSPRDQLMSPVWREGKGASLVTDNQGRMLTLRFSYTEEVWPDNRGRIEIVSSDGLTESVIGYVNDRGLSGFEDRIRPTYYWDWRIGSGLQAYAGVLTEAIAFDPVNGKLLVFLRSYAAIPPYYPNAKWIAAIGGFTTLFEILQTYTPNSNILSLRVPAMPEGMGGADHFDTYYGTLATVGDWSQLQPLQCSYPASPPSVGDYLTVADPLPTPSPGQGYYYVTAVSYMGQTRWGRQRSGGMLSPREQVGLPACDE